MESIEAAGTACHRHDSRSRIEASRRRAGGSAWRASRQWALPDVTATAGCTSWHRAAGRAAARGEHRGSGYCLSSLRQRVAHHGIAPAPARRQRTESMKAADTACHRHDSRSRIEASRRRAGGSAWRASRQWALPDVTATAGRTSWHRAAGRVAARGEHAAVDTACRHYDSGSRIVASRRWAGGSAWRA